MTELGKIAYEAYGACRGWVVFNGDPMPTWDEQSPELQQAWTAAANATASAVLPDPDSIVTFEELGAVGVVQEVNRQMLHPVGLALARHPDGLLTMIEDTDPEGWRFEGFDLWPGANAFLDREREWHGRRRRKLGYVVQPLDPAREATMRAVAEGKRG